MVGQLLAPRGTQLYARMPGGASRTTSTAISGRQHTTSQDDINSINRVMKRFSANSTAVACLRARAHHLEQLHKVADTPAHLVFTKSGPSFARSNRLASAGSSGCTTWPCSSGPVQVSQKLPWRTPSPSTLPFPQRGGSAPF
jgi:hypothetical protein